MRKAGFLARKQGKRPPYDRVLIACEGEKTEPLYLNDIRIQNRISSAHIAVIHSPSTEPQRIVEFAEEEFKKTKAYEWVFAVFDRDDHLTYNNALSKAAALDKKLRNDERQPVRFFAVPTVPCFELWLLIHFVAVTAFFHRDEIINRLGGHIPGYEKATENIYSTTEPLLPDAMLRASQLRERFNSFTGTDPYTDLDFLVEKLRSIRSK